MRDRIEKLDSDRPPSQQLPKETRWLIHCFCYDALRHLQLLTVRIKATTTTLKPSSEESASTRLVV